MKQGFLPILRLEAPALPSQSRPSSVLLRLIMFLIGFPTPLDDDAPTVATAPPVGVDEEFGARFGGTDSRSQLLWSLRSESDVGVTIDLTRSFSETNNAGDDDVDTTAVPGRFRRKLRTRCAGFKLLFG